MFKKKFIYNNLYSLRKIIIIIILINILLAKIEWKYTPPHTRSKTMAELKEQIEKMEKDIRSLAADLTCVKEKNNTLLKNDLVLVLERRLNDKLDILNEKQKNMDDKMSTITQNINTLTQNMRTMTQN